MNSSTIPAQNGGVGREYHPRFVHIRERRDCESRTGRNDRLPHRRVSWDRGQQSGRTRRCRGLREYVLPVAKRQWIDQRHCHYEPVRCGAANSFVAGCRYGVHKPIRIAFTDAYLVASADPATIRRGVADTERGPAILSNPSAESTGPRPVQSARLRRAGSGRGRSAKRRWRSRSGRRGE